MKMQTIIFMLAAGIFTCCNKADTTDITPNVQTGLFELMWATRIDMEKEVVIHNIQHFYKDHFISYGDLGDPATIFGFNADTGNKDWTYTYDGWDQSNIDYSYKLGSILVCVTGHRVFGFDLESQAVIWDYNLRAEDLFRNQGVIAANNQFYLTADFSWQEINQAARIIEFDIQTGQHKTVYDMPRDTEGTKHTSPPVYYEDSDKALLVFNEYPNADAPPEEGRQNIVAIDAITHEVVWRTEHFTDFFYSNSLHPPIIYEDIVITGGDWSIYAFDIHTGEQLWRYAFDYPWSIFNKTNHLIYDGRLYVNNGQFDVTCLDPHTGALIWNNPEGGPNCTDNMVYYEKEDWLVFTSWGYGSVMVLDALTGKTLHRERGYDYSSYNNDVVYDEQRDMFFTSTVKHAVGFKLGREE
jgi:outer membrane protein assembly factor BamB